jgi:hypothetical protein
MCTLTIRIKAAKTPVLSFPAIEWLKPEYTRDIVRTGAVDEAKFARVVLHVPQDHFKCGGVVF